jgi:hypothetical protein
VDVPPVVPEDVDPGTVAPPVVEPPAPVAPPVTVVLWRNDGSAGLRIRLKDYLKSAARDAEGRYGGRGTVIKIAKEFKDRWGIGKDTSHIIVSNLADAGAVRMEHYADDSESGDPSYQAHALPRELPDAPLYVRIYRTGKLHACTRIGGWDYRNEAITGKELTIPEAWL